MRHLREVWALFLQWILVEEGRPQKGGLGYKSHLGAGLALLLMDNLQGEKRGG